MIETRLKLPRSRLPDKLLPLLRGRVFHVSRLGNLGSIKESKEIRPNQQGIHKSAFGYYQNSYFLKIGCVSLFDYRSVTPEELDDSLDKCSPWQPIYDNSGIVIFLLSPSDYPALLSWQDAKGKFEEVKGEKVGYQYVPYVEAGHKGPISLALVDEAICVEVGSD